MNMKTNKEGIRKEIGKALRGGGNREVRVFRCLKEYFRHFGARYFEYFLAREGHFVVLFSEEDLRETFLDEVVLKYMKFKRTGNKILVRFRLDYIKEKNGGYKAINLYVYVDGWKSPEFGYWAYLAEKAPMIGADATTKATEKILGLIEDEIKNGKAEKAFKEKVERFMKSDIYVIGVAYSKL